MNLRSYYISVNSNQFSITETPFAKPMIFIEKYKAFQILDNRPFLGGVNCDLINCGCRINSFVWISHKKKAIYFENPKAGSSSVKAALGLPEFDLLTCLVRIFSELHALVKYAIRINDYSNTLTDHNVEEAVLRMNDIVTRKTNYVGKKPIVSKHYLNDDFELYFGDRSLLNKLYSEYFAFCIVRHPVDRFISNYLMFTQKNYRIIQIELLSRQTQQNLRLTDFISITQTFNNHHWNKQSLFIPESITGFDRHFIGKLENFDEDWIFISEQLGIEFIYSHVNKTERQVINLSDNDHIYKAIKDIYIEDFNRFDYQ